MDESLLIPLPQSIEFARCADAIGLPLRRCKRQCGSETRMWWQVQSRRLPVIGRVDLVSRGPVARHQADLDDWLTRWQTWHDQRPLLLNSDGFSGRALREAGFWPLVTPATIALLPLGPQAQMRAALQQKWRNRLNRAEAEDLRVTRHSVPSRHWVFDAELAQMRAKRYRGLPPSFCAAYARANPGKATLFEARHRGKLIAAAICLSHGAMATWQIGHSTAKGRELNAMNLILWQMMTWLEGEGHRQLDLGTINTQDAPGLARFKLGTGATAHRLGGTWLHQGALAPFARRLPGVLAA